jgi:hypothetical protein
LIDAAAALAAWLGASLVVLSDARRGLALGVAVAAAGLAVLAFDSVGSLAAGALAAGGLIAAVRAFTSGPVGWGIMPPGSTPRLVLCVATAVFVFWIAAGVISGPGAPLRFATIAVIGLATGRVLIGVEPAVLLGSTALLALGVGLAAAAGAGSSEPWPYVAAGAVAAAVVWVPVRGVRAA